MGTYRPKNLIAQHSPRRTFHFSELLQDGLLVSNEINSHLLQVRLG